MVWVAVQHDRIVGGLVLILRGGYGVIANVAVDPIAKGQGLGRALMDAAELGARQVGLRELRLNTHIDMPANVHLYEHLGWTETGRSGHKVSMEKMLDD